MPLSRACPENDVKEQLGRILRNRQFCNAPRLSRFLTYVVEQTLDGHSDLLKGYTIGLEVFDRGAGFDPQSDTIVRVQARALRHKLEHYYATDGAGDPVRITIATGGYRPEFTFAEHEGFVKSPERAKKPSIAVLPFDYTGGDDCHAYIALGLTEGCIAKLSCFRDLAVFSRATTEKAKLARWSIAEIYETFAPDFVLEGSFCINDALARAQIKLINAATDEVIMTDLISIPLATGDMFGFQDEIALLVASRIGAEAGPIGQYATRLDTARSSAKWDAYRWISEYYQTAVPLDAKGRDRIRAGLMQSLLVDPESSEAYATLAMLDIDEYRGMAERQGDRATLDRALEHATSAVQHDPQNAMAHQAMAIGCFHQHRFADFRAHSKRALALNPGHADMMAMFAVCYAARADWGTAAPLLDRAIRLNPLHPNWYGVAKAFLLAHTASIEDALEEMRKAPMTGFYAYHLHLIWMYVSAGDMDAAMGHKGLLLKALPEAESHVLRLFETWCLSAPLQKQITDALNDVGLELTA